MIFCHRLGLYSFVRYTSLSLLLVLAPFVSASAEVVTWEAQGYVTFVNRAGGGLTEFPSAVVGSPMRVRFTFETTTAVSSTDFLGAGYRYRHEGAVSEYELAIAGQDFGRSMLSSPRSIYIWDDFSLSGDPLDVKDGFEALAYVESVAGNTNARVGLSLVGAEYLSLFDGPEIPAEPSPLLTALSQSVFLVQDGTDFIRGQVTSLERVVTGGQTHEIDVSVDLNAGLVAAFPDGTGISGEYLQIAGKSINPPITIQEGDSVRVNVDFIGDQRLRLLDYGDGFWLGQESLRVGLDEGTFGGTVRKQVQSNYAITLIDASGDLASVTYPITRLGRCGGPRYCAVALAQDNLTESSMSFSGISATFSSIELLEGPGPITFSRVNNILAIARDIVIASGPGNDPTYELYPLAGPGTPTDFSESDGEIEFVLYRSIESLEKTVYVSTLQNQGATNVGDYRAEWANVPVTFAPGQDRVQILIRDIDDSVFNEDDETFEIIVEDSPDGALLASSAFTIVDNDFFTLGVVKANAVIAAVSAFGTPYLGDGFTWGGKGWDEGGNYVDSFTLNSGYLYYDRAKYLRGERPYTSFGSGLDCSGLVRWAYNYPSNPIKKLGIIGDWSASNMANDGRVQFFEDKSALEPGDLVFFNGGAGTRATHVAMYIGPQFVFADTCGVNGDAPCDLIEAYCANLNSSANCASGDPENTVRVTNLQRRMQTNLAGNPSNHLGFGRIYDRTSTGIQIRTGSPVDLVVTDPDGVVITPLTAYETSEELIRGVPDELYYSIYDRDADGTPKSMVWSHKVKEGDYRIRVVRRADAVPGSTFTLDVVTDHGTVLLASDVLVEDIPDVGYGVTVDASEVSAFEPTNLPATADAGPAQLAECSSTNSSMVVLDASASTDPDGDSLTFHWRGPFGDLYGQIIEATIPLGTHHVVLTVDDGKGGADSTVLEVTVQDTIAPSVTVIPNPALLWPPNHKMVPIGTSVTATDACDARPSVELVSITTSEGDETNTYDPSYDGTTGDGNTSNDIVVDDDGNISLRAERSGNGPGRVYAIRYAATDASGNSASGEGQVTVPHNR